MYNTIDGILNSKTSPDELNKINVRKSEFINKINKENKLVIMSGLYQNLFHKYRLGLANPEDKINYEIVKNNISEEFVKRKYYAPSPLL